MGAHLTSDSGSAHGTSTARRITAFDVAFASLVIATVGYRTRLARGSSFAVDDWPLLQQAFDGRYLAPYNGHLSVGILGLWRGLATIGGGSYLPFRFVGVASQAAVAGAVYVAVRAKLGPVVAIVIGTAVLWAPAVDLLPATSNHYGVLVGAAACAVLLDRGPRADLLLALALLGALLSAGGGLAVAVACLVHCGCDLARLRRWLAVGAPLAAWIAWYVAFAGGDDASGAALGDQVTGSIAYERDLLHAGVVRLIVPSSAVAIAAIGAFVAYGLVLLHRGLRPAANHLAWSAAIGFWAFGLVRTSRIEALALFGDTTPFRYALTAMVFATFALLPRRPARWPARLPHTVGALALVVVALRVSTTLDDTRHAAEFAVNLGRRSTSVAVLSTATPPVLADHERLGLSTGDLTPIEVRAVLADLGLDERRSPEQVDRALVERGAVDATVTGSRRGRCTPPTGELGPGPNGVVRVWSDAPSWTVEVRGLGDEWLVVADGTAGQVVTVVVPAGLGVDWMVRAPLACRVQSH